ncbi:SMC-Scp complex subunit ScpB [Modestobacter versicolor]|uniref:SMC-Scp complex subunit ScpB n=1 Tax=Modestobacter versicolor TaxID=429133 RepID=UPI0034DE6BE7
MTEPDDEPRPFSWDAVAAEVAAGLEDDDATPVEGWDVVARQLAADLGGPADLLGTADPAAAEEATTVEEGPVLAFGRAPAAPPVELEVVPEREAPVEEAVSPDDGGVEQLELDVHQDPQVLRGGLEALLFVVDAPVDEATLADALRCPVSRVLRELSALAADYDARRAGIVLRRVGEGWRLYTREEHAPVVERHLLEGQRNRLTQAALETLAVIAYRQPVTRARVSAIRGVGVDAVVRTLTSRGLVREAGSDPDTGGGLYVTTPLFLERLGLTGLDELPELAPLLPDTGSVLDENPDS